MEWDSEIDSTNVEARITGEFMKRLQDSDVDFGVVNSFEELIDEDDFGGDDSVIEIVEDELIDDGT